MRHIVYGTAAAAIGAAVFWYWWRQHGPEQHGRPADAASGRQQQLQGDGGPNTGPAVATAAAAAAADADAADAADADAGAGAGAAGAIAAGLLIEDLMTVVVVTSPVKSNPSTRMMQELLNYFRLVPQLVRCKKLIMCDGVKVVKVGASNKFRAGRVTAEAAEMYKQYIANLQALAAEGDGEFARCEVIGLERRGGFGLAVKAALERVATPFVMVVQHDRSFVQSFPVEAVLASMCADRSLKYVGLHTSSTVGYVLRRTPHAARGMRHEARGVLRADGRLDPCTQSHVDINHVHPLHTAHATHRTAPHRTQKLRGKG